MNVPKSKKSETESISKNMNIYTYIKLYIYTVEVQNLERSIRFMLTKLK